MWLVIATIAQFLIIGVLAVVVLSLARQIGILHERTAPASIVRTDADDHLDVGDSLPSMSLATAAGSPCLLAGEGSAAVPSALLFIAPDCPICKSVLPAYRDALGENAEVTGYWVGDGLDPEAFITYASEQGIAPERCLLSQELGLRLGVRTLPSLTLLDPTGRIVVQDVVAGPRQLRALFDRLKV